MTTSTPRGDVSAERCESNACIQVDIYEGEHLVEPVVRMHSTDTNTVMQARVGEWRKFVAEVKNGDWDHVDTDFELAAARHAISPEDRLPSSGYAA